MVMRRIKVSRVRAITLALLLGLSLVGLWLMLARPPVSRAASFTVTTTSDNGDNVNPTAGSLRKAIIDANNAVGLDTITFNIAGAGEQTIAPIVALPTITSPVIIDGCSQGGAGHTGPPRIHLIPARAGPHRLTITSENSTATRSLLHRTPP